MSETPPGDWMAAVEARLLDAAIPLAPALGWNGTLTAAAARTAGLSQADAQLVLPNGARDLIALMSRRHDSAAVAALADVDPSSLKVRERIRIAVQERIDAAMADEAAVRTALAALALPSHGPLALSLGWGTADALWRWAGDSATDENHYSKRAILGLVLASVMAARLAGGDEAGRRALDRRIDQVMGFEKWKAGLPKPADLMAQAASALGRLRYAGR